jgi:hypothetical protein
MPCESAPRRSVSTITSAVVVAWGSDMPQLRSHGDELAVDALRGNSHQVLPGAAGRLT